MDYVHPLYAKEQVDRAGQIIASANPGGSELRWALQVFSNWRASHNYPLNGIAVVLKGRASRLSATPTFVYQRLKRIESVEKKIRARPEITLSVMQDIGGCRAILDSVKDVLALRDVYLARGLTHEFKGQNDYIERPKKDGYRGIHLIYYFVGREERAQVYAQRRMQIEIQIRTTLQHYWATAVETAETFTRQPLKSQRDENTTPWRQFFALVSSCFAYEEGCALVPKMTKDITEIRDRLRDMEIQHRFCDTLDAYTATVQHITSRDKAKYFLVELDLESRKVNLKGFRPAESAEAAEAYTASEQGSLIERRTQTVLVSVNDLSQLKRAYPNYFLDTTEFVTKVRALTSTVV
jgi:hypothetical protein